MNEIIANSYSEIDKGFENYSGKSTTSSKELRDLKGIFTSNSWSKKTSPDIFDGKVSFSDIHNDSIQLISSYNSEWVDTPIDSPSPKKLPRTKMSQTNTITEDEAQKIAHIALHGSASETYVTPKYKNGTVFVTPISDNRHRNQVFEKQVSSPAPVVGSLGNEKSITNFDIFWSMLNTVIGKDKLAKFGQYTLRLLIFHAGRTQNYLSDDKINIKSINLRYNNSQKKLNLLRNFLRHPADFIKIIIIISCSSFVQHFSGLVRGLSTYRQFLRFGKTPFRLRNLINKLTHASKSGHFDASVKENIMNKKTLGDLIGLYYGINDEALLLHKLNVWRNQSIHRIVARHELLAWYYDTLLGLYNSYSKICSINEQEIDLKIQIEVRSRSKAISKKLLLSSSVSGFDLLNESDEAKDKRTLEGLHHDKTNAYIDLFKWMSDFAFNSFNIFYLTLPFSTLQIWMGISASSLSTLKLYRETKKKLLEKASK